MIEAALPTFIATATALLVLSINQVITSRRKESEAARWYADYFLERRLDALSNLYAALVDCFFVMNFYGTCPPATLDEFKEKILAKEEAYQRAKVLASIYLDEDASKLMANALAAFRQARMAIWLSLPDGECPVNKEQYDAKVRNVDWTMFISAYDKATVCLTKTLNPKVLEETPPEI